MRYAAWVDFLRTAEQDLLVNSVARLGVTHVAPHVRGAPAWPTSVASALAELGLLGVVAPHNVEGSQLSLVDLAWVVRTLAEVDAGLAWCVATHNVLGAGLAWPAEVRQAMARGHAVVTVALPGESTAPLGLLPRYVVHAHNQQFILLEGFTSSPQSRLGLAGAGFALCEGGQQVATLPMPEGVWNHVHLLSAALSVGVGQQALKLAKGYANLRQQFGKSIGEFQAVQWKLADSATALDAAWLLVLRAAATGAHSGAVSMAKVLAGEAAVCATDHALQIHGGYGYVQEFDVERLYRDAQSLARLGGAADQHKQVVFDMVPA